MSDENGARMSFLGHLGELRTRLLRAVIAILIAFLGCLIFAERVFGILAAPIIRLLPKDSPLIFTGLPDPFFMYLKISFITGIFIALPYVLYQLWKFVSPGLYEKEKRLAVPFILMATLLFYIGALFCYFVVVPAMIKFFLGYQTPDLKAMISIREYVSLLVVLMLAFGTVFETPIVIVFLGLLGIFDSGQLKRGRRYFVVLAFIIGAILTPTPDIINQTLMAVPMLLLYEVGILALVRLEKRRRLEDEDDSLEEQDDAQ